MRCYQRREAAREIRMELGLCCGRSYLDIVQIRPPLGWDLEASSGGVGLWVHFELATR